jgi:hypothetical protein
VEVSRSPVEGESVMAGLVPAIFFDRFRQSSLAASRPSRAAIGVN